MDIKRERDMSSPEEDDHYSTSLASPSNPSISPVSSTDDDEVEKLRLENQRLRKKLKKQSETETYVPECPVCLSQPILPPIFQCKHGHIICEDCWENLMSMSEDGEIACPSCRANMDEKIRNRALETQLANIKVHCKYSNYGCKHWEKYSDSPEHVKTCRYKPCECPLKALSEDEEPCSWKGPIRRLHNHIKTRHKNSIGLTSWIPKKETSQVRVSSYFWYQICYSCDEWRVPFLETCVKIVRGGKRRHYIYFQTIGETDDQYLVSITLKGRNSRRNQVDMLALSIREAVDLETTQDILRLDAADYDKYSADKDALNMSVKIKKES